MERIGEIRTWEKWVWVVEKGKGRKGGVDGLEVVDVS